MPSNTTELLHVRVARLRLEKYYAERIASDVLAADPPSSQQERDAAIAAARKVQDEYHMWNDHRLSRD